MYLYVSTAAVYVFTVYSVFYILCVPYSFTALLFFVSNPHKNNKQNCSVANYD